MKNKIDWSKVNHFTAKEFPDEVLDDVEPKFIYALDKFREKLGFQVIPSPLIDGWVRLTGSKTSRHYAVGRKSDAGDVFPQCDLFYAMVIAIQCGFTGIGLYFDTTRKDKPEPMLHLDMREGQAVIWRRDNGKYTTIFPRPYQTVFNKHNEGI